MITDERKLLNEIAKEHPEWMQLIDAAMNVAWLTEHADVYDERVYFYDVQFGTYCYALMVITGKSRSEIESLIAYCRKYESRIKHLFSNGRKS